MSKRSRDEPASSDAQPPKRHRTEPAQSNPPLIETITSARQLQDLLVFRQDGLLQLRNGVASFKAFLETILYRQDEDSRPRNLSILREYLDSQKPLDVYNVEHPFLSQLWQTWSFATQSHNDHLTSAVTAVLALLLRTLSSILEFKEYGLSLSRTALQIQHLKLIRRGLDAPKSKDFVISPSIRLLTEIAAFDGGALAREVYKRREQSFDIVSVRRNLSFTRQAADEEEARRKPAVRTLTARYILVLLRHLHEGAKNDILKNRSVCTSLFHNLREDPADLVHEILSVTEQFVLKDGEVPRSAKATLLTTHNLEAVASVATRISDNDTTANRAFAWLKNACTVPTYGILRKSAWYPPGTTHIDHQEMELTNYIDLGLDSLDFYDTVKRPDVRNTTLLEWIQTLRPHTNLRDRELVLTCFTAAPELVAAYFRDKHLSLEPKLSNTWLGYASFLFEVVSLIVPPHMGNAEDEEAAQLPPQVSIMMESLLPQPFSQKTLTKCLNQPPGLISHFAVRILVIATQKLLQIRSKMTQISKTSEAHRALWTEASERLIKQFLARCPQLPDLIASFRRIPNDEEHAMQKEASAHLLSLFYEAAPVNVREESFDISTPLTEALAHESKVDNATPYDVLQQLTLQHYISIAKKSSGIRWFNKHGQLEFSPITTLLRLQVNELHNRPVRELLQLVLSSNNILDDDAALDILVASFLNFKPTNDVWAFMDECFARASRAPVKYVDDLEALLDGQSSSTLVLPSILSAVLVEQLPFWKEKPDVIVWCHRFLAIQQHVLEASAVVARLRDKANAISKRTEEVEAEFIDVLLRKARIVAPDADIPMATTPQSAKTNRLSSFAKVNKTESHDRPELLRWSRKDLQTALEDGDIGSLMLCLCSQFTDVRRQALQQLRLLWRKLQEATLEDKESLSVLVGELIETFERQNLDSDKPLPYIAGTFASRATQLLLNPAHILYSKLNRYMIKSPEWRVQKLPSYWIANTAFARPDDDDAYWKELQWVLEWLVDGLRTTQDMEILRRSGTIEKILAIFNSPKANYGTIKPKILELVYRGAQIDDGADTLVTRAGVLAWLEAIGDDTSRALRQMVLESSNHDRISKWSGVDLAPVVSTA